MFSNTFYIALGLLLAGLIGSRILAERAMKLLSSEEKLALLDSFSRLRAYGSIPLVLVAFSFLGTSHLPRNLIWPAYFLIWAALAAFFTIAHRIVFSRMRELNINIEFQRAHAQARYLSYAGFGLFFLLNTIPAFLR